MWLLALTALADPLVLGQSAVAQLDAEPVEWTVEATQPGILSVAVRAHDELDLVIDVLDVDGQGLVGGRADEDVNEDRGAEQLAVALPWPGTYRVRVSEIQRLQAGAFDVSAGFVPMPAVALDAVTHWRPGLAHVAQQGQPVEGNLDHNRSQLWQWVRFDPTRIGPVTIEVGAEYGDLVLEQFVDGQFIDPAEVSDQDLQGQLSNERLVVQGTPGTPIWLRVRDRGASGALQYKLVVR